MKDINKVIACFKELELELKIDEFDNRIIIQKTIYLLKLKGISFSYEFDLYIRGPYSPSLTEDFYNNQKRFELLKSDYDLTKQEKSVLMRLKREINLVPSILEVAATFAYFWKEECLHEDESFNNVKKLKHFLPVKKLHEGMLQVKIFLN